MQNDMSVLRKIFIYCSQFASREAVRRLFVLNSGKEHSGLMQDILSVPDTFRNESITDFIFGIDDKAIHQRISDVRGMFLFVDYSTVTSSIDAKTDVKTDSFRISITVAVPTPEDHDQATELIWQDRALDAISAIRNKMRDDYDSVNPVFWFRFPSTVHPFVAHSLANSIGWSMEFDVQGIDMI